MVELARGLSDLGWELVASGGTARALAQGGVAFVALPEVTGAAEMLSGRVKTLHPSVHAGILADRSEPSHMAQLAESGISPVDLVVANLYPFATSPSIETIDIGGVAMVRAGAKNWAHVGVVVTPADYEPVLHELRIDSVLSDATRRRLARQAFAHTAAYDAAIVSWLDHGDPFPPTLHLTYERAAPLRYGENPHQGGCRYRSGAGWWDQVTQHAGSELSYLNVVDTDAAWRLVNELSSDAGGRPCAVIVKHANPCGAALADDLSTAYDRALECDPVSAFGGVVALSAPVASGDAEHIAAGPQADVVVAPHFDPLALDRLRARRKATRVLSGPSPEALGVSVRTLGASALVEDPDTFSLRQDTWRVVTSRQPSPAQWADLALAWRVCARATSNAVTIASSGRAVGCGCGQQSRVAAAAIALDKAGDRARGAVAASDAFFPFPDGVEVLAAGGVAAVVQPGGSIRDPEVVAAADAAGLSMVLTGERHFRQ